MIPSTPSWVTPYLPDFEGVLRIVELSGGFVLLPIEVTGPDLARALGDWLGAHGHPAMVTEPQDDADWNDLAGWLLKAQAPEGGLVMVLGSREPPEGVFLAMRLVNERRDAIAAQLGCPLFWCGPPSFLQLTRERAPDFWSVRALERRLAASYESAPEKLMVLKEDLAAYAVLQGDAKSAAVLTLQRVRELLGAREYDEAEALLDETEPALRGVDPALRGEVLLLQAEVARRRGNVFQALRVLGHIKPGEKDHPLSCRVRLCRGHVYEDGGDLERAAEEYERAQDDARAAGDTALAALSSMRLGAVRVAAGHPPEAGLRAIEEGREVAVKVGDLGLEALAAALMARAAERLHDGGRAARLGEEARQLAARAQGKPSVVLAGDVEESFARIGPLVSIARLPATSRVLFGREADLAWLDACWQDGVRVASIVAFGGVGKSALVNTWLARMDAAGWRGAHRVYGWSFHSQGADRLSSSDEFIAHALRDFGDPDATQGSAWDKGERLARLVRRERTILVLDGVEPLQWGPGVELGKIKDMALRALVKELAAQNPGLLLITTRIALTDLEGVGGDKVQSYDLTHLSPEAGSQLLEASGAKGERAELEAASQEYEGHSLALTLLGSYVRKALKGDIRERDRIPPLQGKPAKRMMAIYEQWFADAPELAILRVLGLFDRPATDGEIGAVRAKPAIVGLTDKLEGMIATGWNEAVTTLRHVGLVLHEEGSDDRLDAHPLVREHFGEQLKREQPAAWREGHRRLYEYLKRSAKELPDTIEEMAPLYAAVVHGCMAGKNQEALDEVFWKRIQRGEDYFTVRKLGAFGSEVAVLSAFFDPPWERLAPGLSEPYQALVLNAAGFALRALGRLSEAVGLMRLSLDMGIAQEDWKQSAIRASNLSELLQTHGELSEALAQARKSVELADKSGDAAQRMSKRTTLAAAQHAMGLGAEAAAQFEEAERMQKERQPAYPLLYSLQGFRYCDILLDQGRDAEVRERAAQTLEWVQRVDWLLDVAVAHLSLGRAHLLGAQRGTGGDLAQASSHLHQAVDGLRRAGQQDYLPLGLLARAALHTHTHHYDRAHQDLTEALTLATRCEFRLHAADAHLAYSRLALAQHDPTAARHHLTAAQAIITQTAYHRRDSELTKLQATLPH